MLVRMPQASDAARQPLSRTRNRAISPVGDQIPVPAEDFLRAFSQERAGFSKPADSRAESVVLRAFARSAKGKAGAKGPLESHLRSHLAASWDLELEEVSCIGAVKSVPLLGRCVS